ncbi:MAG TPA: hypothetical protein VFU04_02705 [Solirubrobacterales bacterium]|nr:hypothetical protein [Solirubrobacterales bacterium]
MSELVEKLHTIHDSLTAVGIPHAFGGAVALAYCVEDPRGTRDLDVNIFVDAAKAAAVTAALPDGVRVRDEDIAKIHRDGQARLDWDGVPIDVFLNNLPLHESVAASVVWVQLEGRDVPMLDCASLAIFKAFFDRTQDWADLEAIALATPEDIEEAATTIVDLVGKNDPAVGKLEGLLLSRFDRAPSQ